MLRDLLRECRQRWRCRWVIATARPMSTLRPALFDFLMHGLAPAFVVTEDALLYRRGARGRYVPFWWWNFNILRRRFHAGRRSLKEIAQLRETIHSQFPDVNDLSNTQVNLWLRFSDDDRALRAEIVLRDCLDDGDHFALFRWGREIFLAPASGTKGEALQKLTRKFGVPRGKTLAIGDGPNDVSMLDGSAAGLPACVANAVPHVRDVVRKAGGYVCAEENMGGVIEALQICVGRREGAGCTSY